MRACWGVLFASVLASATVAHAEDEKFLLGDYGLRVELGSDWTNTAWSDWAFEGMKLDRSQLLYVWGTEVQVPMVTADLPAWSEVYLDKVTALKGSGGKLRSSALRDIAGHPSARFEVDYTMGNVPYAMSGATFGVAGQVVHVALVSLGAKSAEGAQALDAILEKSEYRKPPVAFVDGAEVAASGITSKLPAGWHAPLEVETAKLTAPARGFGIEALDGCWSGVQGRAHGAPNVLIACPAHVNLGVVDDYSFEGVDEQIRERFFRSLPVRGVEKVVSTDGHLGFLYTFNTQAGALVAGIVPFGEGVARFYAYDPETAGEGFEGMVRGLMTDSTFVGTHPAGFGQYVMYYLKFRPFSPMVLLPLALLVGGAALLFSMIRKSGSGGPKHDY